MLLHNHLSQTHIHIIHLLESSLNHSNTFAHQSPLTENPTSKHLSLSSPSSLSSPTAIEILLIGLSDVRISREWKTSLQQNKINNFSSGPSNLIRTQICQSQFHSLYIYESTNTQSRMGTLYSICHSNKK